MNYWILTLTFISVNLDFFFMLLFLLKKFSFVQVMLGYLLGNIILLIASFLAGKLLSVFIPEWLLGILGILPIYLAFKPDNDQADLKQHKSAVLSVLITYLAVCSGCNLSIFLPVLLGKTLAEFLMMLLFIGSLTILVVILIKFISNISLIAKAIEKHGEKLMKICYIAIGLYVFWDSGLITHIVAFLTN